MESGKLMSANYVLLEKVTVGASGASSVTFNNIPQTGYTDLVVKVSARSNQSAVTDYLKIQPNGTNPSSLTLWGSGSGAGSYTQTVLIPAFAGNSATANTFANTEIYIPNYTSSNYKSISVDTVAENNATGASSGFDAGLWSNTSPITSLVFSPRDGTAFLQYSTFSLYGIAAVGTTPTVAPSAAGGDIIQTDGTYWYHAFLSSGTFTPARTLSCDVLVVAGGGGGGYGGIGGAGGAGGLSFQSARSTTSSTAYTVTVGAGGTAASHYGIPGSTGNGSNGSNSVFDTITSIGGGGGGANGAAGLSGGSSGSGSGPSASGGTAGAQSNSGGATGYGNASGASGGSAGAYYVGGGGGAGGVGTNGSSSGPGNGGSGLSGTTIAALDAMGAATNTGVLSSGHYYYAGGGGGFLQGGSGTFGTANGGGGINNSANTTGDGTANTGGGGAAAGGCYGGSGVTIIRYLA
jgi:hypothetical protein